MRAGGSDDRRRKKRERSRGLSMKGKLEHGCWHHQWSRGVRTTHRERPRPLDVLLPRWKRSLSYRPSSSNAAREEHCFTTNGLAPVNHRATIRAGRGAYNLRGSGAGIDSLSRPVKRSGRRKSRERVSKLAQVPRFLEKKSPRDVSRDFFDEKVPRFFAKQCKEMDAR